MSLDDARAAKADDREAIVEGSGNVFADLGFDDPEEMLARAELARQIGEIVAERKLDQARAASVLGISRAELTALLRGELSRFPTGRLFRFLNALGRDVEIIIRPARPEGRATTRVQNA
ncbi:MAG TPA: helix-turn-helix transcriptional regulator [Isosphaeraceae bacterium]|jgi:predicted XRE-type DNA-binding protein|nr:helix-turn-helix transcriptional regulator [Isosphaeraceae bacterium]